MKWKKVLTWALTVFISFSAGYITAYPEDDLSTQNASQIVQTHSTTRSLSRPKIASISSNDTGILLVWHEVKDADYYTVYRGSTERTFLKQCETYNKFYKDKTAEAGKRYYYKIKANSDDPNIYDSKLSKWRSSRIKNFTTYSTNISNVWGNSNDDYEDDYIEETVYITNTGEKYHRYGCQYLRQSCIAIDLSDAEYRGYTACSRCW